MNVQQKILFGHENGFVSVNSTAGNRGGAGAVYQALQREPGDPVPEAELAQLVFDATGERPPMGETAYGQVTIRKHVAARLAAMTRHGYSAPMVRKVLREFSFVKDVLGMQWTCTSSLENGIRAYLDERDPRGGVRTRSDQTSGSALSDRG